MTRLGRTLDDLGTKRLTWRHLKAFVAYLPPDAALVRVSDNTAPWGLTEQLLAAAVDLLAGANWQRGGGKGPKPKPLPRPGVTAKKASIKGPRRSMAQMDQLLRRAPRRAEGGATKVR